MVDYLLQNLEHLTPYLVPFLIVSIPLILVVFYIMVNGKVIRTSEKVINHYDNSFYTAGAVSLDVMIDRLFEIVSSDPNALSVISRASSLNNDEMLEVSEKATQALLSEGATNRMVGYFGENLVAGKLESHGFIVEFPDTANQKGYDLIVDGQPVQVKTTLNESLIDEHITKYPDIPVIVPEELMNTALAASDNVEFVAGFNHEYTTQLTHTSLESVSELSMLGNMHVPLVSGGYIAYSQYQFVKYGGKCPLEAVKDLSLELTGSTIGGAVGMAAGTTIGTVAAASGITLSWGAAAAVGGTIATATGTKLGSVLGGAAFVVLGPLGAVAVGIAGAMGGAALGKKLVSMWRMRGVNEKKELMYNCLDECITILKAELQNRNLAHQRKFKSLFKKNKAKSLTEFIIFRKLAKKHKLRERQLWYTIKCLETRNPYYSDEQNEQWVADSLRIIGQNPVFSKLLEKAVANYQYSVEQLITLLKKRGLYPQ